MPRRETFAYSLLCVITALLCLGGTRAAAQTTHTPSDMVLTKHNLSISGRGSIRALTETRICVFCHTPHNATPLSPLWNKELEPRIYAVYASPTLRSGPLPQPSGATKLCLSCHDGTIALGAVINPAGGITIGGATTIPPGSLSNFGLDLSGHHPVSFRYSTALPNTELVSSPPPELVYGANDEVHCTTCHDPHNDTYGRFLLKDNRFSALCITCHQMNGWSGSAHATSTQSVVGILPRPPKTWPNYTQLGEWGCETCHTPHFAPTAEELLNFTTSAAEPFSCTDARCHGAQSPPFHTTSAAPSHVLARTQTRGATDIARQMRKLSAHHEDPSGAGHSARVPAAQSGVRSVVCADCHNPHGIRSESAAAPYVSGMLGGASGVDRNGAPVESATFEYEVCFKCHGDNAPDFAFVPRVVNGANLRLAFDASNASFHPVVSMGKNPNVPSIPSALDPTMSPFEQIYCTACHADDEGSSHGPHGSAYAPILKERYETADGTSESYDNYALCYRCHDRNSILRDVSFRKKTTHTSPSGGGHAGHLAAGAPCSACHDAHGVNDSGVAAMGNTGSHTHLINFDTRIVLPKAGATVPIFTDNGEFAGSCSLVCHGVAHDNASYP